MARGSVRMLGCSMLWRGTQRVYLPRKLGKEVEKLWAWMSLRGSLQGRACPEFYFSLAKFRMSAGNASGKVRKAAGWWSLLVGVGFLRRKNIRTILEERPKRSSSENVHGLGMMEREANEPKKGRAEKQGECAIQRLREAPVPGKRCDPLLFRVNKKRREETSWNLTPG